MRHATAVTGTLHRLLDLVIFTSRVLLSCGTTDFRRLAELDTLPRSLFVLVLDPFGLPRFGYSITMREHKLKHCDVNSLVLKCASY